MNVVTVLHNKAMEFADEALLAKMEGNRDASLSLFEKAFSLEKEAATSIDQKNDSWYILIRSAASLTINCGRYQDADIWKRCTPLYTNNSSLKFSVSQKYSFNCSKTNDRCSAESIFLAIFDLKSSIALTV